MDGTHIQIALHTTDPHAICPVCDQIAQRVQSTYQRHMTDMPWATVPIDIALTVRRFFCDTITCVRKVFCERIAHLGAAYARCTARLACWVQTLAFALGGRPGARFAHQTGIMVSRSTLITRLRQTPLPPIGQPTHIGVDDFALRKGRTYGTIIINLDTHRPIALLPDRETASFAAWLTAHPGITIISRDRASAYADAANQSAPAAIQVADRFHLLMNLTDAVHRYMIRMRVWQVKIPVRGAKLPAAPSDSASDSPPAPVLPPNRPPPVTTVVHDQQIRRARRLARYTQVITLHQQGISMREIARTLAMSKITVARYVHAAGFEEQAPRGKQLHVLDPYTAYLRQRWEDEQPRITTLLAEIRLQGYTGSAGPIQAFLAPLRPHRRWGSNFSHRPVLPPDALPAAVRTRAITAREATWVIMRANAKRTPASNTVFTAMAQHTPEVRELARLVHRFQALVHGLEGDDLDTWLTDAQTSTMEEVISFAHGIMRDKAAVQAGLTLPYSAGPTEGNVNRVKTIKRQMYGRAKFDLLRARVLAA